MIHKKRSYGINNNFDDNNNKHDSNKKVIRKMNIQLLVNRFDNYSNNSDNENSGIDSNIDEFETTMYFLELESRDK